MAGMTVTPNAEAVRQAREAAFLTQRELAEAAGISLLQVNRVENRRQRSTIGTMRNMAKALGVPVEDLLTRGNTVDSRSAESR